MSVVKIDDSNVVGFAKRLLKLPRVGGEELRFSLPWSNLTVRAYSPGFAAMCQRALVHDPVYAQSPQQELEVGVDDRLTSPDIPHATWSSTIGFGRFIEVLEANGLAGAYDGENGTWQFLSSAHSTGIQTLQSPGQYPPWERSFPLRNFLHWAYLAQDMRLIHAGTLGLNGRGVLLAGAGGSGKSGTTLAGIRNGLTSVGDDYICVAHADESPHAYPVMRLMKQDHTGLERVSIDPRECALGPVNWQGKYEFDFAALLPQAKCPSLKLEAILVPRIANVQRSRITPALMHDALYALLPNNLQQLPGGFRQGMSFVTSLVKTLPAYHLELSSNPEDIAETIAEFIEGTRV